MQTTVQKDTSARTLAAAQSYHAAGFSLIPISADGSKAPDWRVLPQVWDEAEKKTKASWKPFQQERPTEDQIHSWFGNGTERGIGIVWGGISGQGEVLDFDQPGLYEKFAEVCRGQGLESLLESLPLIETPSGGRHLPYRCAVPVAGNQKLAETPERKTLIETRGEGGYTVAPGSPPACHRAGKSYRFLRGRPDTTPTISAEDRTALLDIARLFNEYADPGLIVGGPDRKLNSGEGHQSEGLRPGDDYNARGDYEALLQQHGWQRRGQAGDKTIWLRPGKTAPGLSATSNYGGCGLFYVFSSNAAPFAPQKAYSPLSVYTLLEHGGDFSAAARQLAKEGYGSPSRAAERPAVNGSDTANSDDAALPIKEAEWETPVPFTGHDLPPFPVEALPDALAGMVSEVADSIQVPVDMAGMMALATVAAAGARRCLVQVGETHTETLNLYVVVTGEPGERKSGADEAMKVPLCEAESELQSAFAVVQNAEQEQRAYQDKRISVLRERAAKEDDPIKAGKDLEELNLIAASLAEVTTEPRLLADDITPEKLADLMAEQGGAMAIISAEGGIFGIMGGRYNDGKVNLDLFLKAHSGEDVRVDRKGGGSVHVRLPRLTFGLALQPYVLESLSDTPAFRGRGLLGRFLYAMPTSRVGSRVYQNRPISAAARGCYNASILSILSIPQADPQDPTICHALRLRGAALDTWAKYANDVERRQAPGRDLVGIRDWASKLAGAVARIAGGFHLVENAQSATPWDKPISPDTVLRAWAVGEYLIEHALAAYGQMGADPNVSLARRILAWIEKAGEAEFSLRDCHRANRSVRSPRDLEPALALLCERGYLRLKDIPKRLGPGKPNSPVYEVNPMGQ